MFVLIWTTLLFSVRGITVVTGESVGEMTHCEKGFCITLSKGEITAEVGLCVVIPCSFTTGYGFTPQHVVWYKCEPSKVRCGDPDVIFHTDKNKVRSEFKGRVSLLKSDISQKNCSIIINDLTESDSGSYQLRVNSLLLFGINDGFTFSSRATVSVKDKHGPSAELPWVIVAVVSLIVNVIFIILLMFLWNTRKKVKPNQEDRTYMSLRKRDLSPEYDVIARPLN